MAECVAIVLGYRTNQACMLGIFSSVFFYGVEIVNNVICVGKLIGPVLTSQPVSVLSICSNTPVAWFVAKSTHLMKQLA